MAAEVIQTDVLVIGGGGAATRAAITAYEAGAKVLLIVKGQFGAIGTRGGGATSCGIARRWGFFVRNGFPGHPDKEAKVIIDEVLKAGLGMTEPYLVEAMVNDRYEARRDLEKWGLVLAKNHPKSDIQCDIMAMPGMAYVARGMGVQILPRTMVTDLMIQDGHCVGAVGLNETGRTFIFEAGATIIATGGNARLYSLNCHPNCVTGDGYAMGFEAGAELMNMEFMQIFLATVFPNVNLVTRNFLQQVPRIWNTQKREFIPDYVPLGTTLAMIAKQRAQHNPFSTRDPYSRYIDVGMNKETIAGRATVHDGLFLEIPRPQDLPLEIREWFEYRGVDVTRPMEVNTVHQCSNGGFRINEHGETTIPGLYAIGEAATGHHGADRLGGHMMACSQVFGLRAGLHATNAIKRSGRPQVTKGLPVTALERIERVREARKDKKPAIITKHLQKMAWENLLTVRSDNCIKRFLNEVERIRNEDLQRLSIENPAELTQAFELRNLLLNGEMVGRAALLRTESRGGHYREDFPNIDKENWSKAIVIKNINSRMQLTTEIVDPEGKNRDDDMGDRTWG
jgi:fumarate reductase (CoM/CoB) subunit A